MALRWPGPVPRMCTVDQCRHESVPHEIATYFTSPRTGLTFYRAERTPVPQHAGLMFAPNTPPPHRRDSSVGVGLDLGTSNTTLAQVGNPMRLGESGTPLLPSAIAYLPNGETWVGGAARARRMIDPQNVLLSTKRVIGAGVRSEAVARFKESSRYQCVDLAGGIGFQTRRGLVTPSDVATQITKMAFELADIAIEAPACVVVGAPATYDDQRRSVTREAVLAAGARDVRLIDEPVLTAVAYLGRNSVRRGLVYDLGGGTFDVAVIDGTSYPFKPLACSGDPYLGGEDVDTALAEVIREEMLRKHGWDFATEASTHGAFLLAIERAKQQLSIDEQVTLTISEIDPAAPDHFEKLVLTRDMLKSVTQPFVQRTFIILDEVLSQASTRAQDVDAVFLAGGSTRLPGIREAIEAYFGKRPRSDVDASCTVAIGASLIASRPDLASALIAAA